MILNIRVIPNAKKNYIKKEKEIFKIYLTASPIEGKANKLLIKFLSEEYKTKKNKISIVKGEKSRDKVIEII